MRRFCRHVSHVSRQFPHAGGVKLAANGCHDYGRLLLIRLPRKVELECMIACADSPIGELAIHSPERKLRAKIEP